MVDVAPADGHTARSLLVVAYYFPPMGLSGVQRVAKLVKYLPDHGWQPTVLTVDPAGYFAFDPSLLHDVGRAGIGIVRTKSWDPTRLFRARRSVPLPDEAVRRRLAGLSQLLFVPDNKIGWYIPAVRAGRKLLQDGTFDAIFSSAPPYTAHLVARKLAAESGLPLALDFRDDWLDNPRHVYPTRLHRRLNVRLEHAAVRASAFVTTVNPYIQQSLRGRHPDADVSVLPQGFDPEDFARQSNPDASARGGLDSEDSSHRPGAADTGRARMRLLYAGIFYDAQTPDYFLNALAGLVKRRPELRGEVEAVFVGMVPEVSRKLAERLGIADLLRFAGYLPHDEAVEQMRSACILWMTVGRRAGSENISTSKLFEYFGARRPILGLVPGGAARDVLRNYGAAVVVAPDDVDGIGRAIERLHEQWKAGRLPKPDEEYVLRFDRRKIAEMLADRLNEAV